MVGGAVGFCRALLKAKHRITPEIDLHSDTASAQQCWVSMSQRTSSHHTLIQLPTTSGSFKLQQKHTAAAPSVLGDVGLKLRLKITLLKDGWKAQNCDFKNKKEQLRSGVAARVKFNQITGPSVQKIELQMVRTPLLPPTGLYV